MLYFFDTIKTIYNNLTNAKLYNELCQEIEDLEQENKDLWAIIDKVIKERNEAINERDAIRTMNGLYHPLRKQ